MRIHSNSLRLRFAAATLALLAGVMPARAQLTGTNAPAGSDQTTPTISITTRLVIETVVVKDKKGNSIDNLTAKDFVLTEDGVPQKISFCEHQSLPEDAGPLNATP